MIQLLIFCGLILIIRIDPGIMLSKNREHYVAARVKCMNTSHVISPKLSLNFVDVLSAPD